MIFNLVGSLGLFLLGMWLMTEGLKLAGGHALERLLGQWTSSRGRGLLSGILITGLVQSSSAVTVATIGFVNAGILTFQRALWVVFGSNVGTTLTAWIVTFFGFNVKIDALTFPLVGVGAALRIFAPYERGKALGMALAGFGLLFMGIDALKVNFSGYASQIDIQSLVADGGHEILWGLAIGIMLTVLTQSSSAAIAIILTAVASGVAGIYMAAAAVIGANIGTTSTALVASIGATPHVKRLAWAHVVFNLLTGAVALCILPLFWSLVTAIATASQVGDNLTVLLAVFHTCFNVLGVVLMWPLAPRLSAFLLARFQTSTTAETEESHLDANIATVPDLAIRALGLELNSLLGASGQLAFHSTAPQEAQTAAQTAFKKRIEHVNHFIGLCLKSSLTHAQGEQLSTGLSACHHLYNAYRTHREALVQYQSIKTSTLPVLQQLKQWLEAVDSVNHTLVHSDTTLQQEQLSELQETYHRLKTKLFTAAVDEKADITIVDTALQVASLSRRFIEQISQANTANQHFTGTTTAVEPPLEAGPDQVPNHL
ncbi:Na/Pi cotransporter family protein [Exilibacterium tricleocarpae]|uniref:Na/Pi cotransporter family protein n=1 Tax=Exilibacterium tricleocarpae TaxID=2591008 RepID=A0A545U6X2_9GAMM|nr:Na/Pi symporter [Exilibacterium tricleocarpae]TQV85153.1 Na/Pi cotransporter family protein [Exilibacterium tricleocarpae]